MSLFPCYWYMKVQITGLWKYLVIKSVLKSSVQEIKQTPHVNSIYGHWLGFLKNGTNGFPFKWFYNFFFLCQYINNLWLGIHVIKIIVSFVNPCVLYHTLNNVNKKKYKVKCGATQPIPALTTISTAEFSNLLILSLTSDWDNGSTISLLFLELSCLNMLLMENPDLPCFWVFGSLGRLLPNDWCREKRPEEVELSESPWEYDRLSRSKDKLNDAGRAESLGRDSGRFLGLYTIGGDEWVGPK